MHERGAVKGNGSEVSGPWSVATGEGRRTLPLAATLVLAASLTLAPAAFAPVAFAPHAHGQEPGEENSRQGMTDTTATLRPGLLTGAEWTAWSDAFLTAEGRVLDTANANISHSEGQGYGLMLALMADDRPAFERIWSFTRTEMAIRDDGLVAWRWEEDGEPTNITDANNASDGDVLIAAALIAAGRQFGREDLADAGIAIANALVKHATLAFEGLTLLMPAASGFGEDEQDDGPIVNLSYLVFEAFPLFTEATGDDTWQRIAEDGLALVARARFSDRRLPPDWLSLSERTLKPAAAFEPAFGYNAIRIPLYMMRAGEALEAIDGEAAALAGELAAAITDEDGAVTLVDLAADETRETLTDPGYRMIAAAAACIAGDDDAIPDALKSFAPTDYYPSTLHLLAMAHVREERPQCL